MVDGQNDWIIGDSEGEEELRSSELHDRRPVSPVLPAEDGVSSIKAITSMTAEKTSHISSLETDIPARPTISSFPPPPRADFSSISESSSKRSSRPRPRPIFIRAGLDPAANTSTSDPALPCTPTSNHREQPAVVAHSDPTGITNPTDVTAPAFDSFSPDIAERAKMRTRKATKRSTQYAEEVIDITDDDLAITPAKKLKERPKPRPIKRVIPAGNNQQLPSDPMTIPVPSSSPPLPPSDPFTAINSTPPRLLDEITVPSPSHQGSPVRQKKRKRPDRPRLLTGDLADSNRSPTAQPRMAPPPNPPTPPAGVSEGASGVDLDQNLNSNESDSEYVVEKSVKKPKSSKIAERSDDGTNARSERSEVGKSMKKAIVEVVIMSPRKKVNRKVKASRKESSNPAPVEDEDAYGSPQQTSDGDDELMLAPKRKPSAGIKSRKGKQKAHEFQSEDNGGLAGIEPGSERVAAGEEEREESRTDKHQAEHASTSPANEHHTSGSRRVEDKAPVPLKENVQFGISAQGDDLPKPSLTRETPAPGKLRYSLSRLDPKTPMRELIRRAASHPSAPFSMSSSPIASPFAKTTKSALRRIAPLHPTRRTPPPPPPRPPPPKKSKKMLQLEEKWEMELEDEVEGWWALTDEERQDWRRAKRDKELGYDD